MVSALMSAYSRKALRLLLEPKDLLNDALGITSDVGVCDLDDCWVEPELLIFFDHLLE